MGKFTKVSKIAMAAAVGSAAVVVPVATQAAETELTPAKVAFNVDGEVKIITADEYIAAFMGLEPTISAAITNAAGEDVAPETVNIGGKYISSESYVLAYMSGDVVTQEEIDAAESVSVDGAKELVDGEWVDVETDPIEGELTVESVSAINANYVTVAINESDEDRLAQTVEVKNADGKVFEVKALDIAAGDTTADFEFVTAVKAADLVGVWTVEGQSYDLDVFNKIADVLKANTQIELNTALKALSLDNYDSANIDEYFKAQQKLVGTVDATELTVADVQKLVDDSNAKVEAGQDEKALIKAIKEAKEAGNQVAYLEALNNAALDQVNPDWVATATTGYFATIDGTQADLETIQGLVNNANEAIIPGKITDSGIDKAKLTASKELIDAYAPLTDKGEINNGGIKTSYGKIAEQLAVVEVLEATTPTALKNKLTVLAELVDNTGTIDMKNYLDANGKAYVKEIADEADKAANLATSAQIGTLLTTVNAAEATGLVDAVKAAATAVTTPATPTVAEQNALLKALKDLGLKQVADSNKEQYAKDAAAFITESTTPGKNKTHVQKQVDTSNVTAVTSATDADDLLVALKVLELKNVVDANKDAYLTDVTDGSATIKTDATTIDAALKAINTQVAIDAAVKAINEATTATEVKTALDALASNSSVADVLKYLDVTSADRIFIAEQVLDTRDKVAGPPAKEFANEAAVGGAVAAATNARTAAITGVNGLKLSDPLTDIAKALLAVGHESLTGTVAAPTANDTAVADKFIAAQPFDDAGAIKPQFRSIAEIRTAITNAVK